MGPCDLTELFGLLETSKDENLLVGFDTSDDAGVYKISSDLAMVQTVDIITPVVDDPYIFGQIAAANSISDIYAMGGKPLTALNIVCFDGVNLNTDILKEILQGGKYKMDEAGVSLIGGHTIDDIEMKYGLSVTGIIHPEKILRNSTAQVGDILISTKPFGIGVLTTAMKGQICSKTESDEAIKTMLQLNAKAAGVAMKYRASACTDITGFGLLGHLSEMSRDVTIELFSTEIPLLKGAMNYAKMGLICGGSYKNRQFLTNKIEENSIDADLMMLLFDAQTSGGLVFSVDEKYVNNVLKELVDLGYGSSAVIGVCLQKGSKDIRIV